MTIEPSALTMITPPPAPPPPPFGSLIQFGLFRLQIWLEERSPPPPPPWPPTGALSSPAMRTCLNRLIAEPQWLLSLRLSVNTTGPASPPGKVSVDAPDVPVQP